MKIAIFLFFLGLTLVWPTAPQMRASAQELSVAEGTALDLSLEDAVARALAENPTLRAQQATAEARAQLPLQASPAFLPSLSLALQGMRTTDPVAAFGLKLRQENFQAEDLSLDALNRPEAYSGYNATAMVQLPLLVPKGLYGFAAARNAAE